MNCSSYAVAMLMNQLFSFASLKPVHCIPLMDFKDLYCELGSPVDRTATGSGKRVMEDYHTTILVTFSGDEIYMR